MMVAATPDVDYESNNEQHCRAHDAGFVPNIDLRAVNRSADPLQPLINIPATSMIDPFNHCK